MRETKMATHLYIMPAKNDKTEVAELLIKAGANVNERNNQGCLPLHKAKGHTCV